METRSGRRFRAVHMVRQSARAIEEGPTHDPDVAERPEQPGSAGPLPPSQHEELRPRGDRSVATNLWGEGAGATRLALGDRTRSNPASPRTTTACSRPTTASTSSDYSAAGSKRGGPSRASSSSDDTFPPNSQASRPTPCPSPRRKFRRLALLRLTRCRIPGTCLTPPAEAGSCQSIQRKRAPIPSGKRADDRATTTA